MPLDPTVKIEVFGCHNTSLSKDHEEYFCISGPGKGLQGVELRPKFVGAIDAPVKTLWLPGAFGQNFVDFRWERRDVIFTVEIFDPNGDDPEVWHTIDWLWRKSWDYVKETTVRFTSSDGVRFLKLRLLEEPKAYETDSWEGKDPHLYAEGSVVMTTAAELPFYQGETEVHEWVGAGSSGEHTFEVTVDCDVPVWPRWVLTDQAKWTLPDYSWGSEEYGRGVADANREVPIVFLPLGAGLVADSDPRRQTFIAADRSHVQGFMAGKDLLYPILPDPDNPIRELTVKVQNAVDGFAVRLEVPKWYTRPWSRSYGSTQGNGEGEGEGE